MPPEDTEFLQIRSDVAGLKATVVSQADHIARIDQWLQRISDDLRQKPLPNNTPIYVGLLMAVSVLITLGTFALAPVQADVDEMRSHAKDGHPQSVLAIVREMEKVQTRERNDNRLAAARDEQRLNRVERELAVLNNIAEERTERFKRTLDQRDKMADIRSGDRWTGAEQKVYQEGVEQRFEMLERGKGRGVGGRHTEGDE